MEDNSYHLSQFVLPQSNEERVSSHINGETIHLPPQYHLSNEERVSGETIHVPPQSNERLSQEPRVVSVQKLPLSHVEGAASVVVEQACLAEKNNTNPSGHHSSNPILNTYVSGGQLFPTIKATADAPKSRIVGFRYQRIPLRCHLWRQLARRIVRKLLSPVDSR
ncbi:hypothetical protein CEXT_602031 [Caerostris extrusa]|uniref:Uncharacterized protein n=1 Tax=Caerostris extrusa TaxID=172846 RepID=A0AAV4PU87_CAEEX|nr:hypothetical protein CEXT_602031 [Caerostris extrusa]